MTLRSVLFCVWAALMVLSLGACRTSPTATSEPRSGLEGPTDKGAGEGAVTHFDVKGVSLGEGVFVGSGKAYGNLTVFPILAKTQLDVGPLASLHDALESGDAELRELKAAAAEALPSDGSIEQHQAPGGLGTGAQVDKLAIENKGKVPVYVLAGTIVKGGNQDRQIGQDFIIGAKETVPIDAFCVEHGRWNENRGGTATGGKFSAVKQLANSDVRVAGQYKADQNEVWSKVSEVNKKNKKHSSSDSLLATADDAEIQRERDALSRQIVTDLDAVAPQGAVVGYAYAVDGEIRGVRWFAHHRVFAMFREVLVNTAVIDAITAKASGGSVAETASAEAVAAFVAEARKMASAARVKATDADNTNEYAESADAYHSTTTLELADEAADGKVDSMGDGSKKDAPKKKVKMSVDFVKKK